MTTQRILAHEHKPHRVYMLLDRSGSLLYVGVSSQVEVRIAAHMRTKPWADQVDRSRTWTSDPMPWEGALALEQSLIQSLLPRHNARQTNASDYVRWGARADIATERRLKRAARHGGPAERAALERWQDEQRARAAAFDVDSALTFRTA